MLLSTLVTIVVLLSLGLIYEALALRRDARRFPPVGRLIDVGGHRLHLLCEGSKGPTVVIEQGAGGPSLAWRSLQEQLAHFTRVCIYDRAGYQWSEPVPGKRSLENRVIDLNALLVNGGLPPPYILVAHSYGGFLVRLFARHYPASVAGLVLVDTPHEEAYCQPEVLSFYSKLTWLLRAMSLLSRFGVPRLFSRFLTPPQDLKVPLEISQPMKAGMLRRAYFSAAADDLASLQRAACWLKEPGALGDLGNLPLAVITHGQSFPRPFAVLEKGWREGQYKLAALSSNSIFLTAEKSNHMIQNDQPEIILEAIAQVVSRTR